MSLGILNYSITDDQMIWPKMDVEGPEVVALPKRVYAAVNGRRSW